MGRKKGVVEEYKRKLELYEQKKAEDAKIISIDDILNAGIKQVYIPELGGYIRYGPLTIGDLEDLGKAKSDDERATLILYKMLRKADDSITLEKVKQLPVNIATRILNEISGFLQSQTDLSGGSELTNGQKR